MRHRLGGLTTGSMRPAAITWTPTRTWMVTISLICRVRKARRFGCSISQWTWGVTRAPTGRRPSCNCFTGVIGCMTNCMTWALPRRRGVSRMTTLGVGAWAMTRSRRMRKMAAVQQCEFLHPTGWDSGTDADVHLERLISGSRWRSGCRDHPARIHARPEQPAGRRRRGNVPAPNRRAWARDGRTSTPCPS